MPANSHIIDYQIKGESIQIVEVELDPLETVIAEAGAMLFMEEGIVFETRMGDGSNANQSIFDKLLTDCACPGNNSSLLTIVF